MGGLPAGRKGLAKLNTTEIFFALVTRPRVGINLASNLGPISYPNC